MNIDAYLDAMFEKVSSLRELVTKLNDALECRIAKPLAGI